jgi:hypothetical protein
MKTTITLLAALLLSGMVTSQENVNKHVFYFGMEFNVWNYDVLRGQYSYFNYATDSNEELYNQAVEVIEKYGMTFSEPTEEDIYETEIVDIEKLIYERETFGSDAYIDNVYENDDVRIVVKINESHSSIHLYIK